MSSAIQDAVHIMGGKLPPPSNLFSSLPQSWTPVLDLLVDAAVQRREARHELYVHCTLTEVNRWSLRWLHKRLRYELMARAALNEIRAAKLRGAIVWNGQLGRGAVATLTLRELRIPTLYSELTPFKGRYFLDHLGVNGASSLQAVRPEELDPYEDEEDLYATLSEQYVGRRGSTSNLNDPKSLPRSFVFAPLQVPTDTQILLHGGAVQRHCEYIDILRQLRPLLPPHVSLVVKPHPVSPYRASYLRDAIAPDVCVASDYETRDLLERCAAIVTVNSSVGIDGFLFDKPIIALGKAPWIKPALAKHVCTPEDIAAAVADPPAFDKRLRQRFLAHWYHAYTWRESEDPKILEAFVETKFKAAQQYLAT